MSEKKDTIKLELPHAQAQALAAIVHALADCLEPLKSRPLSDDDFPHKWKGIAFTTFMDIKIRYDLDNAQTILRIDEHMREGLFFGYHFRYSHSTVLTLLADDKLPNSPSHILYPSMNDIEEYDDIMFFPKILTGMERSKPPRYEIDQDIIDLYTDTAKGLKSGGKYLL